MKIGLIAVAILTASLSLMGCASNQGMQAKVDALSDRAHQQDAQIADLEARAAKLKEQSTTAASSAWDWTSQHASDAWNSDTSKEARERFQRCWADLRNNK